MYPQRRSLFEKLEASRQSKVLLYVTGDRAGLETQIGEDSIELFVQLLDRLGGNVPKISLVLYTRGGDAMASWTIVNLVRQFCQELEVIVPAKAFSGGTLICLGANSIVMTKQATLGPIDPSLNGPLNPVPPGAPPNARVPVSVEAVAGFVEFARELGMREGQDLGTALSILTNHVHPLVLGEVQRRRAQIRNIGESLLRRHMEDQETIDRILSFLGSDSGSHDYKVFRQEARDVLGMPVSRPSDEEYAIIRDIHLDYSGELQLRVPYNPNASLGSRPTLDYAWKRALVESVDGGSYYYVSEGTLTEQQVQTPQGIPQRAVIDHRNFDGWKHEPSSPLPTPTPTSPS